MKQSQMLILLVSSLFIYGTVAFLQTLDSEDPNLTFSPHSIKENQDKRRFGFSANRIRR